MNQGDRIALGLSAAVLVGIALSRRFVRTTRAPIRDGRTATDEARATVACRRECHLYATDARAFGVGLYDAPAGTTFEFEALALNGFARVRETSGLRRTIYVPVEEIEVLPVDRRPEL